MFATAEELATLLHQDLDRSSAEQALALVEADLLWAARVETAAELKPWAKTIGLQAAARLYTNPAGLASDALDDYRRNFGDNYLSVDERARLAGTVSPSQAFTITPFSEPQTTWVDTWSTG